jgi:acetolactate synthase-1/2/3 large subunit
VNLAPALLEAYASDIPLVAVVGEFLPTTAGRHAFQEADHAAFLGTGLTKEIVEARHESDLYGAARYAAERAAGGRPRPVLLQVSDALLWGSVIDADEGPGPARGVQRPSASIDAVHEARALLAEARRPVVLAGAGVHSSGAYDELLELARLYALPVATSMSGKGAVPEDDPRALGVVGSYVSGREGRGSFALSCLQEADLVLVIGSDLDALTVADGRWPQPATRMIRVDLDAAELRTFPAVRLHGDARTVLRQLLAAAEPASDPEREGRLREIADGVAAVNAKVVALDRARVADGTVWPGLVAQEINDRLQPSDWVVADASFSSGWALDRLIQRRIGRQIIAPRGVGTLGWGLPAAMGVAVARPTSRVTAISGDGALFFALPEMESAVRWGLDLTLVLLRNDVYGSQRSSNLLSQGQDYGDLVFGQGGLDHCVLAAALGWSALRVVEGSDFSEAYDEARATAGPTLIEVAVSPEARPPVIKFDALLAP